MNSLQKNIIIPNDNKKLKKALKKINSMWIDRTFSSSEKEKMKENAEYALSLLI